MLNFYNYYGKIHPELMKKLKNLEEKTSGNNNVLVIRPLSSKDTPESFDGLYAKGETVYYDDGKMGVDVTPASHVQIEISQELASHILNDIDNIIFYFTGGTQSRYEGLIYEKRRIRRNILQSIFHHRSIDQNTERHIIDTIICRIDGDTQETHFIIDKVSPPM